MSALRSAPALLRALCAAGTLGLWMLLGAAPAAAQPALDDAFKDAQEALDEEFTDDQAEIEARIAELEEKFGRRQTRVVVLPWPGTGVDHKDLALQEVVRNRIGRAGAKFYPSLDLYQEGRMWRVPNPDPILREPITLDQPGRVPDSVIASVRTELRRQRGRLRPGSFSESVASALIAQVERLWYVDDAETRELLFDLYVTIGQATYSLEDQTPPYFRMIGGDHTNYYLYLAAAMIWDERNQSEDGSDTLTSRLPRGEIRDFVEAALIPRIRRASECGPGQACHPVIPLSLHEGGQYDWRKFKRTYKRIVINGLEREVPEDGLIWVPRGRIDVHLERRDGFSLSDRVEVVRLDEKVYFVLETAKQKMGFDLLRALMVNPEECSPYLEAHARATVATYAALHPEDEIYVAIPKGGSRYDVYVWRWDRIAKRLLLQIDRNRGFPVRFALVSSSGMIFNGLDVTTEQFDTLSEDPDPNNLQGLADGGGADFNPRDLLTPQPGGVPVDFQLRGHFNRLMFGVGIQFAANISDESGVWRDRYQTDGNPVYSADTDLLLDPGGASEVYRERTWQRLVYGVLGVVLLKDAAYGMGPRIYLRTGWYNAPHAVDVTGHIGITEEPTFGKKDWRGRVVPLLDADFFAGTMIPFGDTLYTRDGGKPLVMPTFGFTVGAGLSF